MGDLYKDLNQDLITFIQEQPLFFVGTAPLHGNINVSPKGMDTFRVINNNQVAWLNLTGSGNETAAHLLENNRMTIMFCSFTKSPMILRLYGKARVFHERDDEWKSHLELFPKQTGARQIFVLDLEKVQKSCGYAVPKMELLEERKSLEKWATGKGRDGIRAYWKEKNEKSLDGKETGIFDISTPE